MKNLHLCSDLATIYVKTPSGRTRRMTANIEEISTSTATLQLERPVASGTELRLQCSRCESKCNRRARVEDCQLREGIGYDCAIVFEEGCAWDPGQCRPQHLFDPSQMVPAAKPASTAGQGCPHQGVCPREVIARLVAPEVPLAERARAVAREVAVLCGELDDATAGSCFSGMFHAGPGCRLFDEFLKAYRAKRRRLVEAAPAKLSPEKRVRRLVRLLDSIPAEALGEVSCSAHNKA
jgi:hypothetical protein